MFAECLRAADLSTFTRLNSAASDLVLSGHPLLGAVGLANASKRNAIRLPVEAAGLRAVGGVFRICDVFGLRAPIILLIGQPVFSAPRALLFEADGNSACVVAYSLVFVMQKSLEILPLPAAKRSFPGQQAIHITNPLAVGKFIRSKFGAVAAQVPCVASAREPFIGAPLLAAPTEMTWLLSSLLAHPNRDNSSMREHVG